MKKYKYISKFPKPFLEDLLNNRCIPIVGAGFSKNGEIPSGKKMPNWDELGKEIASHIPDFNYTNALDSLSAYAHEYSRTNLIEKISELLLVDTIKPGETHKAFCQLPFNLVVTTNFEFLLEHGYALVNRFCIPIIDEDQLAISSTKEGVSLLKLHGDINHPRRLVITEDDYDRFLNNYPMMSTFLSNLLITKTPFFIGYSLDDNDFRQIWQIIQDRLGKLKRQAYTITVNSSQHEIARFNRRKVKVINVTGDKKDYTKILRDIFLELQDYSQREILNYTTITNDDTLAELTLPQESNTRLCFFSIPLNKISFYRKYLFPIVKTYGFIPVTAEDIISPGDNWTSSISAMIKRAELLVVDASTNNTLYELKLALSQEKKYGNIFVIADNINSISSDIGHINYYKVEGDPFDDPEEIISSFETWISEKSNIFRSTFEEEPRRLFKKREYRASVISAITLLETYLLEYIYEHTNIRNMKKPFSLMRILGMALDTELIDKNEYSNLKEWLQTRNKLVHDVSTVNHNQAKKIVFGIYNIIDRLEEQHNT